ncbi:hypothetical protein JQM82_06590 [Faecalicatena contorta]|nr:hypothetical protein [Faecalicatena contorta]
MSIGLPLEQKTFATAHTRIYFEGLLPEGFTRRCVAEYMHLPVKVLQKRILYHKQLQFVADTCHYGQIHLELGIFADDRIDKSRLFEASDALRRI